MKKPIKKKYKCECGEIVCVVDADEPQKYCPVCGKRLEDGED